MNCVPISLADLFWQALEELAGSTHSLRKSAKPKATRDPRSDHRSVGEILREPPTLPDRVIAALNGSEPRTAVFLYRAGALYPAYRTSALIDDLRADSICRSRCCTRGDRRRLRPQIHGPHRAGVRLSRHDRSPRDERLRDSVKIQDLFRRAIGRPIEKVIQVDLSDEAIVAHEIDEYVATETSVEHLEDCSTPTRRRSATPASPPTSG